jgi:hypothetical protein
MSLDGANTVETEFAVPRVNEWGCSLFCSFSLHLLSQIRTEFMETKSLESDSLQDGYGAESGEHISFLENRQQIRSSDTPYKSRIHTDSHGAQSKDHDQETHVKIY